MQILVGLRVLQIGPGLAAAACGRAFADVGAMVSSIAADDGTALAVYLNDGKQCAAPDCTPAALAVHAAAADLLIVQGSPQELAARGVDGSALRQLNNAAVIVLISPHGQTGPDANRPASDLTLFCDSGIARMLTGQVDDLSEPPTRAVGRQSAFIGGLAAAAAGMHALLLDTSIEPTGATIDVSIQEALATLAMTELTRIGMQGKVWSRRRLTDGNGATVTILPARDGYVAISPRENHQWAAWLQVMGSPDWGQEARFAAKPDRVENWDALHALMSAWSRTHDKQWIADAAQAARVPSFPLQEPAEQFASAQLAHRQFFRPIKIRGECVMAPGSPFRAVPWGRQAPGGIEKASGAGELLPLSGMRVLDFSWVIAGPTATRYLAAMGAEVIKVEAPGRGDPGRGMGLHAVLGQAKRGITLDLHQPKAAAIARALAARADIVIENFGTGVMERLGLGPEDLARENPEILYLSASGHGRDGPEAGAVAYGTLLQCYAGFAGLNGHPNASPRVGMAWVDPMCGLKLAFIGAAGIWHRHWTGGGMRIDFSMMEALLWTMAEPLLAAQLQGPLQPQGNADGGCAPHGIFPSKGDDAWVGIAVCDDDGWRSLCAVIDALGPLRDLGLDARHDRGAEIDRTLTDWTRARTAKAAMETLLAVGIPAAVLASSLDLKASDHLHARGFWQESDPGVLPGLPWRASFGRKNGPAPGLGDDTDPVLGDVLSLSVEEIAALRASGALG